MSLAETCQRQRDRLEQLGLRVCDLTPLRDFDGIDDARAVAATIPGSRFARAVAALA